MKHSLWPNWTPGLEGDEMWSHGIWFMPTLSAYFLSTQMEEQICSKVGPPFHNQVWSIPWGFWLVHFSSWQPPSRVSAHVPWTKVQKAVCDLHMKHSLKKKGYNWSAVNRRSKSFQQSSVLNPSKPISYNWPKCQTLHMDLVGLSWKSKEIFSEQLHYTWEKGWKWKGTSEKR